MKKILFFFVALCAMTVASQKAYAETVTVTSNSSSGIEDVNLTITLDNGMVYRFYK